MKLLQNYIAKSVASAIAVVILVIVSLDVISELVQQLSAMKGAFNFLEVMVYVSLSLPSSVYD